jgi:FAD:protein FMN transferase
MNCLLRRQVIRTAVGAGAVFAASGAVAAKSSLHLEWQERIFMGFGTKMQLRAAHVSAAVLTQALNAALARLRHIETVMSVYQSSSQLSQLNQAGFLIDPDPDLLAVLKAARHVASKSNGAFDVTVQPLWTIWHQAATKQMLPTPAQVAQARRLIGWQAIELSDKKIQLTRPGMALTLNGIAQGYACDQARAVLQAHGVEHALLDLGEWAALGRDQSQDSDWTIGISHPQKLDELITKINLTNGSRSMCLATSSDAHTFFTPDRRFHHIFDPQTGASPSMAASVSVIAPSCTLADALTKVFFMASANATHFEQWVSRSKRLCQQWNVNTVLVDKNGRSWIS